VGVSSSYTAGPGDFEAVTVSPERSGGDGDGDVETDVSYPVDNEGVGELAADEKSALCSRSLSSSCAFPNEIDTLGGAKVDGRWAEVGALGR